jgi:hypothetical protein
MASLAMSGSSAGVGSGTASLATSGSSANVGSGTASLAMSGSSADVGSRTTSDYFPVESVFPPNPNIHPKAPKALCGRHLGGQLALLHNGNSGGQGI